MMIYPKEVLRLLNVEGFNQAFEEELPKHRTHLQAYEAVEEVHERYFTFRRYMDFENFRRSRYQMIRARRKNRNVYK
jgi:hypothetical protein